jgi:transcriptional regulator with XRE-family HTH domain
MLDIVTIKEVKLKIGEWCKQKRQGYELSQEDLAEALNMSRITIVKVESGKNVNIDTLLKIANHFDGLQNIYQLIKQDIDNNKRNSLY